MSSSQTKAERRRKSQRPLSPNWRKHLYDVIFEADTPAGRWFDIGLLIAILASITVVSLETVPDYRNNATLIQFFEWCEWILTFLFTIEYVLRLICSRHPIRYAFSFWGIIDLLSILPSYVTFFAGGSSRSFVILRSVRLLRVFRVLKLWRMMNEADELASAIWRVRNKIVVFLTVVLVAVTISGTLMYHIETISTAEPLAREGLPIEVDGQPVTTDGRPITTDGTHLLVDGQPLSVDLQPLLIDGNPLVSTEKMAGINPDSQFTSIPQAMYWAIVTMTTVGYGDVVPKTSVGKCISAILILLGYSLIIVPSTFVSAAIIQQKRASEDEPPCENCDAETHHVGAEFCYRCGERLGHA